MKYRINGIDVSQKEFAERHKDSGKLEAIFETHTAPGGHEPYWGTGHDSISASVPSSQAKERHDYLTKAGCTGFEISKDGELTTSSPENHKKVLAAMGMADAGSAGSDARASTIKRGT